MAYIVQPDIIKYACTCGSLKPISRIYFCRHCLKLRCGYCVSHEVDSHYCSTCLENLPSSEARLKKHKCANCFICPSCLYGLTTRAASVTLPSTEDPNKTIIRKEYYLFCGFCRWTSRDAGIPDQTIATGGWPERENIHATRVNALAEYFRNLGIREKVEKERKGKDRKHFVPRRTYFHVSDKFGLTVAVARKRAGLPPVSSSHLKDDMGNVPEIPHSAASEDVEKLPESIFSEPVDLTRVTTLTQRLAQPEFQPTDVSKLYPVHKHLLIKRSQRCRTCEHNLSKPEYSPVSIKFKIQLSAYYHVPEIRLITCQPLAIGKTSELIIKLCNPTQHQSTIQFLPLPSAEEEQEEHRRELDEKKLQAEKKEAEKIPHREDTSLIMSSLTSMSCQISLSEDLRLPKVELTGTVELPAATVILPQRDDAAEYDDSGEAHNFQDDPKVVLWRKANKAAVKLLVTPSDTAAHNEEIVIGFLMQYTYVNTMATLEIKEPKKVNLKVKVYVKAGKLLGNA